MVTSLLLIACSSEDTDTSKCTGLRSIVTPSDAQEASGEIMQAIKSAVGELAPLLALGSGGSSSYSIVMEDDIVNGLTGSAVITGSRSYDGDVSCGTNCSQTTNNTNVVATLSNFSVTENGARITGSINYSSMNSSQLFDGDRTYNSRVEISDNGSPIEYDSSYNEPMCSEPLIGLKDTITGLYSNGDPIVTESLTGDISTPAGTVSF